MSSILGGAAGTIISVSSLVLADTIARPIASHWPRYASTIGSICGMFPVSIALLTALSPTPFATGFKIATVAISVFFASFTGIHDAHDRNSNPLIPPMTREEWRKFCDKTSSQVRINSILGLIVAATTTAVFGMLPGHCLAVGFTYCIGRDE